MPLGKLKVVCIHNISKTKSKPAEKNTGWCFSTEMKATCKNSVNLEQETKKTKIVTYPLLSLASSINKNKFKFAVLRNMSYMYMHCSSSFLNTSTRKVPVTRFNCIYIYIYLHLHVSVQINFHHHLNALNIFVKWNAKSWQ